MRSTEPGRIPRIPGAVLQRGFSGCGNNAKLIPLIPAMCPEQEWPELNGTEKVHKQLGPPWNYINWGLCKVWY